MRALEFSFLVGSASGWVTISQARFGAQIEGIVQQMRGLTTDMEPNIQQKLGYLWTFPEDSDDVTGLGGGITWQWDPRLCDSIIPQFSEDFFFVAFITCSDLKAAMHRAFASWSDNHKDINFVEVTEECAYIGKPGPPDTPDACPLAEVWVTAIGGTAPPVPPISPNPPPAPSPPPLGPLGLDEEGGVAESPSSPPSSSPPETVRRMSDEAGEGGAVNPTLYVGGDDSSAATASPEARISQTFRYTNGARPYTLSDRGAFSTSDTTVIVTPGDGSPPEVSRLGKSVEILDGKVVDQGKTYTVQWVSAVPPDGPDTVFEADGAIGGNVTLLGGNPDGRYEFYNPQGYESLAVIETYGAIVSFNTELCWYLDSTFCSYFHKIKNIPGASPNMVLLGLQVVLFSIFSLAALIDGFQLFRILSRTACHGGSCLDKLKKCMDEISKCSIIGLTFRLLCIWAPPISYANIFLPCWNCFDFEGAATHEIGHVLGLSHPDAASEEVCKQDYCGEPGQNSYSSALVTAAGESVRMNASTCGSPWDAVRAGLPGTTAETLDAATGVRDSIMEAFTQHNPSVCLTQDDLEALNVIYPQCEYAISERVCYKTEYYIGWIRLGVWVGIPVIICLFFIMLLSASMRHHHLKRLDSARQLVKEKSRDLRSARGQAHRASCEAAQLAEALDMQIATEESRINERAHRMSVQMVAAHLEQLQIEQSQSTIAGSTPSGRATSPQQRAMELSHSIYLGEGSAGSSICPDDRRRSASNSSAGSAAVPGARKWLGASTAMRSMKRMGSKVGRKSLGESSLGASGGQSDVVAMGNLHRLQSATSPAPPGATESSEDGLGQLRSLESQLRDRASGESSGGLARTTTMHVRGAGTVATPCMDRSSTGCLYGGDGGDGGEGETPGAINVSVQGGGASRSGSGGNCRSI